MTLPTHPWKRSLRSVTLGLALFLALAGGCGSDLYLVPSPNLYTQKDAPDPFTEVAHEFRTSEVRVLYGTDRVAEPAESGKRKFGYKRAMSLEVGYVTVSMGDKLSWEQLVAASRTRTREHDIVTQVAEVTMLGRYPDSNLPPVFVNGMASERPEVIRGNLEAEAHVHATIKEYIAPARRKEIFLYIHGYNNTFDEAAVRIATLWHFLGREGVPVIYSWPAGSGGILRGYNHDRESGEFAVFHLKQFYKALASSPDVKKIHIIAHSRGADVTITALRELNLEFKHQHPGTRERLKIGNLILAASDLDWDVFNQRFLAERLGVVMESCTIYVSQNDKAISLSDWLFASGQRLGTLMGKDVKKDWQQILRHTPDAALIDVASATAGLGHAYFVDSPETLSDLILVLRDGRKAGAAHGRPLVHREDGFWEVRDGYPFIKPAVEIK